jgi:hypothetical protein
VRVAGLFEQIRRDVRFERGRAQPTRGPHDEVFFDDLGAFLESFRRSADSDSKRCCSKESSRAVSARQGEIARRLPAAQKLLFPETMRVVCRALIQRELLHTRRDQGKLQYRCS